MNAQFILASGNSHKAREFADLFDQNIVRILSAPEKLGVEETGTSFQQNALLKAEKYFQALKAPTLSDDSGLEIFALPGEMGIHSARFGGEGLGDRERALLLLEKLKDNEERGACFVCFLCFYLSPGEVFFFEGRMEGSISHHCRGREGFGYDPIFIPTHYDGGDKTLAEIPEWKRRYGHRAKAVGLAQNFFMGRAVDNARGFP